MHHCLRKKKKVIYIFMHFKPPSHCHWNMQTLFALSSNTTKNMKINVIKRVLLSKKGSRNLPKNDSSFKLIISWNILNCKNYPSIFPPFSQIWGWSASAPREGEMYSFVFFGLQPTTKQNSMLNEPHSQDGLCGVLSSYVLIHDKALRTSPSETP